ncbi:MAG: ankyrin repeat domain-containing protein [Armatimonadota bacterium]
MYNLCHGSGADVNAQYLDGQTPLTVAAIWDRPNMIEFLVGHGVIVDAADGAGITPLHYAAMNNNVAALEMLLWYGADPLVGDLNGKTAFDHAIERKAMGTASALYKAKG